MNETAYAPGRRDPARIVAVLAHALGILLALSTIWLFRDCVVDDAWISLRYVRNFVAGNGLVYNVGDRVEGFTNLGFALVVAGLGAAGVDLLLAARIVGLVGAAVAVWLVPIVVAPGADQRLSRALARLGCLSSFALVYLSWGGLETGFFTGVVAVTAYAARRAELRPRATVGLWSGLAFATRPEGALVGAACLLSGIDRGGLLPILRGAGTWIFTAIVVAVELFRWTYFGALVPNTALVKGIFAPMALPWYAAFGDDVVDFFSGSGGTIGLVLVLVAVARPRDRLGVRLAILVCAAVLAFEVYSGGDWMLGYRYLQPAVPWWFALVAAGGVAVVESLDGQIWVVLGLMAALAVAVQGWSGALRFRQDAREYPQFVMTSRDPAAAAKWIAERYPADMSIACGRIGALGWFTGMRIVDTNGLVDREIARRLGDSAAVGEYLARVGPDLALVRGRPGEVAPTSRTLWTHEYGWVRDFDQGEHQTWQLYKRR